MCLDEQFFIVVTGWTPFGDSASIPEWAAVGFSTTCFSAAMTYAGMVIP